MNHTRLWAISAAALLSLQAVAACQSGASQQAPPAATAGVGDPKKLAAGLQTKTITLIDAINAKNNDQIARAKSDLTKEADNTEDALKSQTGPASNQVNAAIANIRQGVLSNNVDRLTQARDQLQRAQQQ